MNTIFSAQWLKLKLPHLRTADANFLPLLAQRNFDCRSVAIGPWRSIRQLEMQRISVLRPLDGLIRT
jgi:hypothetical protein